MNRRIPLVLLFALALAASGAPAATAAAATPPPRAGVSRAAAKPATRPVAHAKPGARTTTAAGATAAGNRRLTDVHIEGEMPVPQVLFITARDQRRYVDFQHQRYLPDSRSLGAATRGPAHVAAAGDAGHH